MVLARCRFVYGLLKGTAHPALILAIELCGLRCVYVYQIPPVFKTLAAPASALKHVTYGVEL